MSAKINPVTQVALVAVKRAVMNGVALPFREEIGNISKSAPHRISRKKPKAINCIPERFFIFFSNIYIPHKKSIRNKIKGISKPLSNMLTIILPGGVTHEVAGEIIAAIIIPTIPMVPLKIKNPLFIELFIYIPPIVKVNSN